MEKKKEVKQANSTQDKQEDMAKEAIKKFKSLG